ncbi:selenocysteine-specific translation elongation factor [Alteribacter populi]|uniref:selenocysteine-specific translation elongation factor n=1 Tax=Alteribacter populi TaxID=2011011 RepID=UPI000BBAFAFC|nr:selenocysteine-specific translation elongation factor [Alteribacter populi]
MKKHFTIGMAGHIDHGKTALTKALTNVDTDRLKEEKERSISIELGFAPVNLTEEIGASIIDVPGHERFIRQMIAGVAGIDLVMLVIAADEGVMPQTVEHLEILEFLGVHKGLIVITKIDQVDEEMRMLVETDVEEKLQGSFFEGGQLHFVDSLNGEGIAKLKQALVETLEGVQVRDAKGAFRLPIDQVFTVHGQGTVVRGTVYEGEVREGESLEILPQTKKVRTRQLQVHNERKQRGLAGQRVALNIAGLSKEEIRRGDVLVSTNHYQTTQVLDVDLQTVAQLDWPLKQRTPIKVHIGTAEVHGRIVFFDRNELTQGEHVLCQLRLDEPVVSKRGDRFILRRPTPVETIGGGVVIDPNGERYRFGKQTVRMLEKKKEGSPKDRVIDVLKVNKGLSTGGIEEAVGVEKAELVELIKDEAFIQLGEYVLLEVTLEEILDLIKTDLSDYHESFPLRPGINKAELVQSLSTYGKSLAMLVLNHGLQEKHFVQMDQFVAVPSFSSHFPRKWKTRMGSVEASLKKAGMEVASWEVAVEKGGIPSDLKNDFRHFLIREQMFIQLDEKHIVSREAFDLSVDLLKTHTDSSFTLQEAKGALQLSRKYLVPFLEKLDELGLTKRSETEREWA